MKIWAGTDQGCEAPVSERTDVPLIGDLQYTDRLRDDWGARSHRLVVRRSMSRNSPTQTAWLADHGTLGWKEYTPQYEAREEPFDKTAAKQATDELRKAITYLAEGSDISRNARLIDSIHEQAHEVCLAAEARLRLLSGALEPIPLARDLPEWAQSLAADPPPAVVRRTLESFTRLVRAAGANWDLPDASVAVGPSGTIEVTWDVATSLTWIVSKPRLSWPGISVRSHCRVDPDRPELRSRTFLLAHRLLADAGKHLA